MNTIIIDDPSTFFEKVQNAEDNTIIKFDESLLEEKNIILSFDQVLEITSNITISGPAINIGPPTKDIGNHIIFRRGGLRDFEPIIKIAKGAKVDIVDVVFEGSWSMNEDLHVESPGHAIENRGRLYLNLCDISQFKTYKGGSILNERGSLTINASLIYNNLARMGGGIYTNEGQLIIYNSRIFNNRTSENPERFPLPAKELAGGGGIFSFYSTIFLSGTYGGSSTIENNKSAKRGGGIFMIGGRLVVGHAFIAGNKANSPLRGTGDDNKLPGSGIWASSSSLLYGLNWGIAKSKHPSPHINVFGNDIWHEQNPLTNEGNRDSSGRFMEIFRTETDVHDKTSKTKAGVISCFGTSNPQKHHIMEDENLLNTPKAQRFPRIGRRSGGGGIRGRLLQISLHLNIRQKYNWEWHTPPESEISTKVVLCLCHQTLPSSTAYNPRTKQFDLDQIGGWHSEYVLEDFEIQDWIHFDFRDHDVRGANLQMFCWFGNGIKYVGYNEGYSPQPIQLDHYWYKHFPSGAYSSGTHMGGRVFSENKWQDIREVWPGYARNFAYRVFVG